MNKSRNDPLGGIEGSRADGASEVSLAHGSSSGRPSFRSPAHRATVSLFRTTDLLRRHLSQVVQEAGVTLQQFNVLRILRGAGEEGLPTLTVGERMVEQTPGITRLLDRLERRGWVSRGRCQEDRRRVLARITPEGRELLSRIDGPMARAEDAVLGALGADRVDLLSQLLEDLHGELTDRDVQPD